MAVSVMDVWVVRVRVCQFLVPVRVRMWFTNGIIWSVSMLVVFVVRMKMFVLQRLMMMLMLVPFRKVQPYSCGHEECCHT